MFHWIVADNGRWYGFWSGFGSDLAYGGVFVAMWRHLNCHAKGCWRLGRHPLNTRHGAVKVCHRHHPEHKTRSVPVDALHADHIAIPPPSSATPSTQRRAPRAAHAASRSPRAQNKPPRKES